MMGLLDDFEQYPDYAMRTTQSGERIREPWASGPSPLAQGLMALGSGMVGDGATPWVGGGGAVWDDIGKGMRSGTQAFLQGHQDLQNRRSDYYTQRRAEENQLINNQKYRQEQIEKQALINNFPSVLKSIADTGRPELQQTIDMLKSLFITSPEKAVVSAMNIISQIKKTPGNIKTVPILDNLGNPTGHHYIEQNGEYKATVKTDTGKELKLDNKKLDGILFKAQDPKSNVSPENYRRYYKIRQENSSFTKEIKQGDKERIVKFASPLEGYMTPWEYGESKGLTEQKMTELGWKKDPTIEDWMAEGTPIPRSEDIKSSFKFAQIIESEKQLNEALKLDPEFNYENLENPSAEKWLQYALRGLPQNPFSGTARSLESIYMAGAQGFTYLFSGATARAEELTQFRAIMYPLPGDTQFDIKRKEDRRKRGIEIYNSSAPDSLKQAYEFVNDISKNDPNNPYKGNLKLKLQENRKKELNKNNNDGANKKNVRDNLPWE